jgi:hypothetical protein
MVEYEFIKFKSHQIAMLSPQNSSKKMVKLAGAFYLLELRLP